MPSLRPAAPPPAHGSKPPRPASRSKAPLLAFFLFATTLTVGFIAWQEHLQIAEFKAQLLDAGGGETPVGADAPRAAQSSTPAPVAVDEPPAPSPADNRQRGIAVIGALLNNPQVQQFATGLTQNAVANAYAGLVQQLNLNDEQAAAFNDLVAQRVLVGQQVLRDATAQGVDVLANRDQLRQQVSQQQAVVDDGIHALLGDSGYQQYQDYSSTVRQNFRASLGGGGL